LLAGEVSRLTRGVFYGWWIVLAGSVAIAMSGGLFFIGFGFFFEPIRQHFGWSRTMLSGAYASARFGRVLFGPFEGYLIQRLGPRNVMTVAFVAFGLGFILLSRSNSILAFYAAFLVLATGAETAGFSSIMASINNWFRAKRARAVSFAMLGMGLGGIIFPPILALGFDNFSWRTVSLASGIFVVVVGVTVARLVRYNPEPYGCLPDGVPSNAIRRPSPTGSEAVAERSRPRDAPTEYDFSLLEALKTRAFWMMSVGHAQALLVVSVIALHLVPYLETGLGFSRASAATVVMVLTGVNMFGQIVGGFLGDRFPKNYLAAATMGGHTVALLVLATADSYTQVIVSAVIQGLAWGVRSPVLTSMRGEYFGRRSFAVIMGFSHGMAMVGMIVGPLLSGYFADHFSYSLGFKVIAACTAPGFLLFVFLRNPQPKATTP
jgi:MFS family permease